MNSDLVFPDDWSGFDSRDCVIIFDDGPGDTTVRPCPPHLLPLLMAEREKLIRWGKLREQPKPEEKKDTENPEA